MKTHADAKNAFVLTRLQAMQSTFAASFGVSVFMADAGGNRLTVPDNANAYCPLFAKDAPPPDWRAWLQALCADAAGLGQPVLRAPAQDGPRIACIPIGAAEGALGFWVLGYIAPPDGPQGETPLPPLAQKDYQHALAYADGIGRLAAELGAAQASQRTHAGPDENAPLHAYTGLPNEKKLLADVRAGRADGDADAPDAFICLQLLELEKFIDFYGANAGAVLLRTIAAWIAQQPCDACTLYHCEDDLFCLHIPSGVSDLVRDTARGIWDRFSQAWALIVDDGEIRYFCPIALSILDLRGLAGENVGDLLRRSLLSAREHQHAYLYTLEHDRDMQRALALERVLKSDVQQQMRGFSVHYQPIVDISAVRWVGVEALCRWQGPSGPVPPDVFIAMAEKLGLINRIGGWVLETAIAQCKSFRLDESPGFYLSVNVSPTQMMDDRFAHSVLDALAKYDFPSGMLNLEITESTEFSYNVFTLSAIQTLRAANITMALDDFGTGYSAFNSLKKLPVSYVKTERAFINGIEQDGYLQYFLYIMTELAHANNMKLIAEGIETQEQMEIVRNNGVDFIQGYFFSKPLPAEDLAQNLHKFKQPDNALAARRGALNIQQWLMGKEAYVVTPNLFMLLNQCMQLLLSEDSVADSIQRVLSMLGTHFSLDHCFLYVLDGDHIRSVHAWHAAKAFAPAQPAQGARGAALEKLRKQFLRDNVLLLSGDSYGDTRLLLESFCPEGTATGMLSPMWENNALSGMIGFASQQTHLWSSEEVIMLVNLSIIMGNTLRQESLRSEVHQRQNLLLRVLNVSEMSVLVIDLRTRKILWANDRFCDERQCTLTTLVGSACHAVTQGRDIPCEFCRMEELLHDTSVDQISFEYYNPATDRTYVIYSSLIQWGTHGEALIEYSLDITENRKTRHQLEMLISADPLTKALNRTTLTRRLTDALARAEQSDAPVSIAYVDMDGLGEINRLYGYEKGDQALCAAVDAIRKCIRNEDLIGRLTSDTFVVAFQGCKKRVAHAKMLKARVLLSHMLPGLGGQDVSFSFGMVENTQFPYAEGVSYTDRLLASAAEHLQAYRSKPAHVER